MDLVLEKSPSFYLKRVSDIFEHIMCENVHYPLQYICRDDLGDNTIDYLFVDTDYIREDYEIYGLKFTNRDRQKDIVNEIEHCWKKYSIRGSYLPIKVEASSYCNNNIKVRLSYDEKTYYYMLANKEVDKLLKESSLK